MQKNRLERTLEHMYTDDSLSDSGLFGGCFTNFGFWKEIPFDKKYIKLSERINSQRNMYNFIFNFLKLNRTDTVLEVGCGQGIGLTMIFDQCPIQRAVGIDPLSEQIKKSKKNSAELRDHHDISFVIAPAETLPFEDNSFSKIFSIEAAQHFNSFELFVSESFRALKKNGMLVVAAMFAKNQEAVSHLPPLIQTMSVNIDKLVPIQVIQNLMIDTGFRNIKIVPIGEFVWEGFDRWVSQTHLKESWTRNWFKAYQKNYLDYYVIIGEK